MIVFLILLYIIVIKIESRFIFISFIINTFTFMLGPADWGFYVLNGLC